MTKINDSKTINEKLYKLNDLDRSVSSLEDRLKEVNEKLDSTDLYVNYFENQFNPNLTGDMPLSEDIPVCKSLEKMANYLLMSDESKQMDKDERNNYVIHKDRDKFMKKLNRENSDFMDDENIVHFLIKQRNDYKPKTQKITAYDINKDTETGRVLREYNNFLKNIDKALQEKPDSRWFMFSRAKSQVKSDMLYVKKMLDGVWGENIKPISVPKKTDYYFIDFTDYKTVEYLIKMEQPDFDFNQELWLVWLEFNDVVKKANLTEEEYFVFYLLQKQWNIKEISEYLNINYDRVKRTVINNIVKKIIKVGDKYSATNLIDKYRILNKKLKNKEEKDSE